MKQILHIFSKDVRRLWIEILLSVVAAALFAWVTPKSWGFAYSDNPYRNIASVVALLLEVSWCLLIGRLIHGEVLVGDRQFWITRPFEWPKLLAAKALFIGLFIYLPFLLLECAILLQAGFNPLAYVPGLLYRLLLISLVFFPLIGLAAVTSNLARMVLTLLGILVAFVIVASTLAFRVGANNGPVRFYPVSSVGLGTIAIVLLACGTVVVLQYARRRTLVACLLLGSTPVIVLLFSAICNGGSAMDRIYPPAAQTDASVIRMISFEQDGKSRAAAQKWGASGSGMYSNADMKKWAVIKIKLRASGVAAGDRWSLVAFRPTLTPANDAPLKLDWQPGQNVFDKPDDPDALSYIMLAFLVPRADYERLKSSPLTLHLDFAFTQARPIWSRQFPLPEGNFMIPDFASCSTMAGRTAANPRIYAVVCRFPLRLPEVTTVTATMTKGPCGATHAQSVDPVLDVNTTAFGDFSAAAASFGISPMEERELLGGPNYDPYTIINGKPIDDSQFPRLCPGTPVVVTQYRKVRAVQTGMTIENFNLTTQ